MAYRLSILFLLTALLASCSDIEKTQVFDEAGNLIQEYHRHKEDFSKQGPFVAYYPEGGKLEEASYVRDTLDGVRKLFYPNGEVQIEEHYQMGLFEGPFRSFYENGQTELEGLYQGNAMTGIWKRYYASGQLMEEVTFVDNQENGPFVEYHENGKLKAKGTYQDGDFEQGLLELFDEMGALERKMDCDHGTCQTIWQRDSSSVVQ